MNRCTVCDALHHEDSLACEAEATAILRQRYQMISGTAHAPNAKNDQESQDIVVSSRQKQLEIAARIQNHRALAHSA